MSCPVKIVPTGEFADCVAGKVEMYRIEPHECPKCGEVTDEFAGEYIGRKGAEAMVKIAAMEGYKCFHCVYGECKQKAKRLRSK